MKPHLLYIAFWYPPSRASGVYRAIATVRMFLEAGWHVTVITTSTEYFEDEIGSTDVTLLAEIPDDADVIRVPFSTGLTPDVDIRSMGRWAANLPAIWNATRRKARHSITERYIGWIDPVVGAGAEVNSRRSVDHILATGNPYSAFEAARILAGEIGAPFSVDFRDPWTIDVFSGARTGDRPTIEAERRIIDEAQFAFHVNDPIAHAYQELYPNDAKKHRVVFNGYDPESIPDMADPNPPPYRFGILGTMNDRWPMPAIFKGWDLCRNDLPEGSELVLAGHLGYFAHSRELLESKLPGQNTGFRYVGPVHKADVSEFYDSIDIVVLPVPGGPMVTSGKVFEALALGKPVVCVQSEGGGARTLLDGHPLAIGADPDTESVKTALLSAADLAADLEPSLIARVRSEGTRYERRQAMAPMLEAIAGLGSVGRP